MRAVVQRVNWGRCRINGEVAGEIGPGLVIFLGVGQADVPEDGAYLAEKIANLRVFADEDGKFNLAAAEVGARMLVVSQFTLYGDCRKGRRPSFTAAAPPEEAERLYEDFVQRLGGYGLEVATGRFQAHMEIELANDGPVTLLLDSQRLF
ncbi:MAG: D-aminoacyl-tRNA deacylase [Firmicutes bacterium]|nr:D-aminoacyl-tRNA deacylase [Bacillota bacterium]